MISQNTMEVVNIGKIKFQGNIGQYTKKFKGIEKEGEKTCVKCAKSKPLGLFNCSNTHSDGKHSYCKKCLVAYNKYYHAKITGRTIEEIENRYKIVNGKKKCARCLQWKSVNIFGKHANLKYGMSSYCKNCISRSLRAHNFKESRRIKLICMIGYGGKCICCGEIRLSLLTIEHIRDKGHELIYDNTTRLMKKLIELGFPEGYTVLCWNCNLSTANGFPCIHSIKEYEEFVNKNIEPYNYGRQKELDELERKWIVINGKAR